MAKKISLNIFHIQDGCSGIADHLRNGSSINKQITYGEYLEKDKYVNAACLFNAFIMPYNMAKNPFNLDTIVGNIGEAVGDWRNSKKYYERIQGIVMDTRYLIYNYTENTMKKLLADCIEKVLKRKFVTFAAKTTTDIQGDKQNIYGSCSITDMLMVAEEKVPYGRDV